MEFLIDRKNYETNWPVKNRQAARAIIRRDGKLLLITSKYGDYKFPGGGVELGEDIENALVRETLEETGHNVDKGTIKEFLHVRELRKGEGNIIVDMYSNYFLCNITDEISNCNLDEYEQIYDYQVAWVDLETAIRKNNLVTNDVACPWIAREIAVMEILLKNNF